MEGKSRMDLKRLYSAASGERQALEEKDLTTGKPSTSQRSGDAENLEIEGQRKKTVCWGKEVKRKSF